MLRAFWGKVKYIEGILGIEILVCIMEGKNGRKTLKVTLVPLTVSTELTDGKELLARVK